MKTIVLREQSSTRTFRLTPESLERAFGRVHARRSGLALVTIEATFGLSRTGLGRLFGVSRQAVDAWIRNGAPALRNAEITRFRDVARSLSSRFISERIPAIVNGALPALGGRSILETLATDGPPPVLALLDRLTSYVPA